jgi:hypothetical protein
MELVQSSHVVTDDNGYCSRMGSRRRVPAFRDEQVIAALSAQPSCPDGSGVVQTGCHRRIVRRAAALPRVPRPRRRGSRPLTGGESSRLREVGPRGVELEVAVLPRSSALVGSAGELDDGHEITGGSPVFANGVAAIWHHYGGPKLHENPRVTSVVRASDIPTGHEGLTGEQRT